MNIDNIFVFKNYIVFDEQCELKKTEVDFEEIRISKKKNFKVNIIYINKNCKVPIKQS